MKQSSKSFWMQLVLFCFALNASAQTADFISDVISGCNPLVVSFTDISTGTSSSTIYAWDFGDSKTSILKSPSTTYIAAGTYTVKLTIKNGASGTPSIKTKTITVYPSPTISFTASPISACPCTEISFTNTSIANAPGAITSVWSFGDGGTATTNNSTHVYCTPGSYDVALKVTNSVGCLKTKIDTAKVVIQEKPIASFRASKTSICKLTDTIEFTSSITKGKSPYTYSWNFGDGFGVSSLANPKYRYGVVGTFDVRLIVTDANGCSDTILKSHYINAYLPSAKFKVPSSSCPGVSKIGFENTSTPTPIDTRWFWSDGGGTTGLFPQRYFWKGGTYTITMIDSFGEGCVDTAVHTYTVYPKPKPNFSYSPIYPCPAPATITFTNKSSVADSFLWIFGDGSTSKLKNPVHTYTWDSVFTVYLIGKTVNGCLDTFRVRDTSKGFPNGYPNPYFDSSNSPIIVRVHKGTLEIATDSSSGCLPFVLKPIATLCGRSKLPADTFASLCPAPLGYASPPYWKCGYSHPTDKYADEFADPYIIPSKTSCTGDPHPYPIVSYYWDFGDGTTSTVDSPTHTYTVEGEYYLKVTVTTHNGCSYTDSLFISTGSNPIANFSIAPSDVCIHDSITITNASHYGVTYKWSFGDGTTYSTPDSNKVFKHRYDISDTFKIVLTANRYGCRDTMSRTAIVRPPQELYSVKYFCDSPLKVQFFDESKAATSRIWRFGDGSTSTATNPIHYYSSEGTYSVTHTVFNNVYNCSDSNTFDVSLFIPKPFFKVSDSTVCIGDTVTFSDSSRYYITSRYWTTGDTTSDNNTGIFKTAYKDSGRYDVTYTIRDIHNCIDTFKRKGYVVVGKPQMKIYASPVISCAPATILFKDSSTNTSGVANISRKWYWGDATNLTSTSTSASKTYLTPGTYVVTLVTTDEIGCKDSIRLNVESRKPTANFTCEVDTFTCVGKPNRFYTSSSGAGLSYVWDFGDGSGSTIPNPTHTYASLGTFTVKLVVTDETGCKDSITKTAFIKTTKPTASFTQNDSLSLCPPLLVSFTNTSSNAIRYMWDFDNGSTSTLDSPVSLFSDAKKYNIRLVAVNKYGCTDTAYGKARVMGYDGALTYTPLNGCAPLTVDFVTESFNFDVMVWDFADGYTESAKGKFTTSHTYTEPGYYVPRLILGDGKGCSTSSKGLDTIKVDGVTPVISLSPACIGQEITFNDSSYSYFSNYDSSFWIFDDSSTSTGKNPKRTYDSAGVYKITLISTNTNGCKDTIETSFTVRPLPTIVTQDTIICLNDQLALSASGGVSYYWLPDPSLSCSDCDHPISTTKVPIQYYVIGTDEFGCQNMDTLNIGIKTKTAIILAKDAEVCALEPLQLFVSGALQYSWSPTKYLDNPNIANPIAKPESSVIYRVIGTEGSCIPDTAFINVTVHPTPEVNAGPDQRVLAGTIVQLNGSGKYIDTYLWSPADSLSCSDCPNPSVKPNATTTYTLKGVSRFGCSDSDDVVIVIFCDQSQLFIPNTFTPNGDGQNDYFFPQGKGVSKIKTFIIYNRWGQKVFERTNMDANTKEQGWDGTLNGNALNPDTFVYTIEADCANGETVFWKGDVTIIK